MGRARESFQSMEEVYRSIIRFTFEELFEKIEREKYYGFIVRI